MLPTICAASDKRIKKEFLAPETISVISENFIKPINTMFLNALNMIIAPVIFFSVLGGVTGLAEVTGDIAATTAPARTENLLDEKIYFN